MTAEVTATFSDVAVDPLSMSVMTPQQASVAETDRRFMKAMADFSAADEDLAAAHEEMEATQRCIDALKARMRRKEETLQELQAKMDKFERQREERIQATLKKRMLREEAEGVERQQDGQTEGQ
ncbi:hypothetical protein IWQ57_000217 [Coemansia nantahalensis]|uniref:Uncharacterized protein n=1 Tax=Coemansia nantahalensis TaxID=2789366 RepID=A0ACC1K8V6_9FUNG|nr:hypothetical protein IWQ57_000217 [Coemansia nantahalensis]